MFNWFKRGKEQLKAFRELNFMDDELGLFDENYSGGVDPEDDWEDEDIPPPDPLTLSLMALDSRPLIFKKTESKGSEKVSEWIVMAVWYNHNGHEEFAAYCLREALIEAGVITLH